MPTRTSTMQRLEFAEKLTQTGKGAGTDALLKRLKSLHGKLSVLEQDVTDVRTLNGVKKQLIDSVILHHKDRGVKAYAACCLADLLRLYAPDAPYTADELRDIFQFFVVQITQNLRLSPSHTRPLAPSKRSNDATQSQLNIGTGAGRITEIPYYTEYCYLLDNLATIKSVVLICDLPGGDELITTYFENFVDVVRPDMNKNIIRNLVSILAEVLNESGSVPSGVMDCILGQFEAHASQPDIPSFQLVVDVCNKTLVRLQRPIFAHFSEIQLSHGRDPTPADLKTLTDSHTLLLTIFRNSPNLLLNVIPLLEENLRAADEVPLRQLSTQTLGIMFGERPLVANGIVDIARAYPSAWRSWLGRKVDKALPVRLAWVEAAGPILINHPEARKELETELSDRIQDSDERVRAAVCKLVGSLDYETALHHISHEMLVAVGGRMSDKKAVVRAEATAALAKLWSLAYSEIEANDEEAVKQFAWIPNEMLLTLLRNATIELKAQVTAVFKSTILPLPSTANDEQAWVDRFLLVASHLDDNGLKGLDKLTGLLGYARGSSPFRAFVEYCEENNGGIIDIDEEQVKQRLAFVIDAISHLLYAEAEKARKDLELFAAANEPRLYKLFRALVDPQSDLKTIIKSKQEFLRRIEQSHTDILETFTTLVDSAGWVIVNHSSIPGLLKRLQKYEGALASRGTTVAKRYLALMAKECAPMFKSHVPELVIVMNEKRNPGLVEVSIQALAAVCKWDPKYGPSDLRVIDRAVKIALTGTPRQAKFAARLVANGSNGKVTETFVHDIWLALEKRNEKHLLALLSACSELALSAPVAFETKTAQIIGFLMKEVMLRRSPSEDDTDCTWVDEEQLTIIDRAKLIGMRVCTHRSLGWARDENAATLVEPTFNLLTQVIKNDGQVNDNTMEGGRARCHMRLRAALCILKLANVRSFDKAISEFFVDVAFTMQDVNFTVRNLMLRKLAEILPAQRLMPKWNLLPILVAQDPEAENLALARSIMVAIIRGASRLRSEDRIDRIEMPLARLLHLLTQHPDLDWEQDDLKDMAKFIEFFVEIIGRKENIALLYLIANKLKTVCVASDPIDETKLNLILETVKQVNDDDETSETEERASSPHINLYKLSELAQIIIKNKAQHMSWPLSVYPGKVKLPRDIFHNLPSHHVAQQVSGRSYLSEEVVAWAKNFGKKSVAGPGPTRRLGEHIGEGKKRARTGPKAPRKKRRPSRTDDEDDEDQDEDEDEDQDEDQNESDEEGETGDETGAEGEDGDIVMGRGGRRSAKTKAKRAVKREAKLKGI